ncbi:PREDICTED: G-protein coupled receptor 35-like [Pygoscelis adeliae]|uniref:G-protein coupled receptor 35-like n=1 Tax=Pygoscelis adeliae TaxID=9238 RepID=UPI0004F4D8EA|nr:PREDICTED: G-protein coupled receptor 35-like [Pygoscelis adeliae]
METPGSRHAAAQDLGNRHQLCAYMGDSMWLGCLAQTRGLGCSLGQCYACRVAFSLWDDCETAQHGDLHQDYNMLQDGIVLFQLLYIAVLSLGIPLNMIAFWVFCCKLKRWTETRVYVTNLMVADSFLLFALPFLIYFTMYNHPIDKLCFTIQNIYFTNMPMSILIITLIATDRYIVIKFPLKAKILRSPLKSASICGFLWIMLIIYSYLHPKFHERKEQFCLRKQSIQPNYSSLFSIIFGSFIPLGIVVFCSVQVIKCLKKKMARSPHETKLIQKAIHIVSVNLCVFIWKFVDFTIPVIIK